ncbi:GNAT family N-acetyltransferase [Falsirhodobacter halotolerans]|uniref:GNAT family N-acetyltransferase n=1 Tax=Falsirhodobacter halotolerans TaxID=1146892 RepID=UPI001FD3A665|nr:GNAT family N-acetyltransferase [Falsirhodobacter halotolerans]MCJ8140977.1 GNAT family N-acetyltransferase [Falsirhodobacter halotolerans]
MMQDDPMIEPRLTGFDDTHLPGALHLSRQAGWPHRIEDWALTLAISEGVVAIAGGRVVGTAMCTQFGPVATISLIIVDSALRGRGVGRRLMTAVLDKARGCEMRLTATADGLPLYEKLGFVAVGTIVQHQGMAVATAPEQPVRTGDAADLDRLLRMDRAATGMERATLLRRIAGEGEVLATDMGVAVLRPFGRGHVVGPVIADTPAAARALMAEAARRCAGGFLRVDLPARHDLSPFAETLGLAHAGGGTAMTTRPAERPASATPETFALVSQAFG